MGVVDAVLSIPPLVAVPAVLLAVVVYLVVHSKQAGLDDIPGPWLAKYTDAWRAYNAWRYYRSDMNYQRRVFKQYGDVIRIGPKTVLVSDPEAINTVFGFKTRLEKGPGYKAFAMSGTTATSLVGIRDEATHGAYRRPVAHAYSLSSLKAYEPYIDDTIDTLVNQLDKHANNGQPINMTNWMHYWAFDTIVKLTFGAPIGFMEKGSDFNGMIKTQKSVFGYIGVVSNIPTLDAFLKRNPILKIIRAKPSVFFQFAQEIVDRRVAEYNASAAIEESAKRKEFPDLLANFIAAKKTYPNIVTDHRLYHYTMTNVVAGANATSLALDQGILFLASSLEAQERLYHEIKSLSDSPDAKPTEETNFSEHEGPAAIDLALKLPYLEAVILESYRTHNSPVNNLERLAPYPDGLALPSGHHLPAGTNVAMNNAPISRREDVYGADANEFNPERWMRKPGESDDEFKERRWRMERASLTFGHGSRSCIGKNIVQLEVFKIWATVVGRFRFDKYGELKPHNVVVTVQRREKAVEQVRV